MDALDAKMCPFVFDRAYPGGISEDAARAGAQDRFVVPALAPELEDDLHVLFRYLAAVVMGALAFEPIALAAESS